MNAEERRRVTRGYVVIFACFAINTLMLGYVKCFGILLLEFIQEYNSSASMASAVMGLTSAFTSLMSLVALNVLTERLSIRSLALLGAVCASTGVVLSSTASTIHFIFFSQSILVGSGQGLLYGPGIVLIGQYFNRRRTLATAVATSGISAGAVLLPLLLRYLLDMYGFRGALLIMGGVLMEMLVFAGLYSPPERNQSQAMYDCCDHVDEDSQEDSSPEISVGKSPFEELKEGIVTRPEQWEKVLKSNYVSNENYVNENTTSKHQEHLICAFETMSDSDMSKKAGVSLIDTHGLNGVGQRSYTKDRLRRTKFISYSDSICLSTLSLQETVQESKDYKRESSHCTSILKDNLKLFKNSRFLMIAGFTFFGNMGTAIFPAFVPPLAKEIGLTDVESAFLVSLFAVLDFVSRLASGAIAEVPCINRRYMLVCMFLSIGVMYQFTTFFSNLTHMLVFVVLFGSINGIYAALVPALLVDFLGTDKFSKVFGFVQVFHGAALSISFPILGLLRDLSGTYTTCFYLLGASQFTAALILMLEPCTRH